MTKIRLSLNAFVLFVFSLTFTTLAQAQVGQVGPPDVYFQMAQTFVKPSGNDGNPCARTAPCKTFNTAMTRTTEGGEVIAMESGIYEPVSITKAIVLVAPPGVQATIAPTTGNAITINAGGGDVIVLRNLSLNKSGSAVRGIFFNSGEALRVEGLVITGFSCGISFSDGQLSVRDTIVRGQGTSVGGGIQITSGTSRVTVERSRLEWGKTGFSTVDGALVTIRDTVLTSNEAGISSTSSGANSSRIVVDNCVLTHNHNGIELGGATLLSLTNSTVSYNYRGLYAADGAIFSRSNNNNTIAWNSIEGTTVPVVN